MSPETASLVALIIVICAVLVASGAVLVMRAASGARADLARRREAIGQSKMRISRGSAGARDRLEQATIALARIRVEGDTWDDDMQRLTESLRTQRESIERMTQGRLANFIRFARVVSKAAQFAFLWR